MNTAIYRRGAHKQSKTGVRGVYWHKQKKRWAAEVRANGRKHNLGKFREFDDAVEAVQKARRELHGEYAT